MPIELVVFDVAGTTVEDGDAVNSCFRAALAEFGLAVDPAAVNAVMGLHKPEAIRRLVEASPALRGQVDAIHRRFADRMRRHYAEDPAIREVPGAAATFADLRRAGVKTALNTGFGRDILDGLLARLGWSGYPPAVDAVIASDEVPRGRPHPDMIRSLMARLGVLDTARVAKVGDTPVDLEEGANAGCGLVVGVTTGAFPRAALARMPHAVLIDSVADVLAVLRNRGEVG